MLDQTVGRVLDIGLDPISFQARTHCQKLVVNGCNSNHYGGLSGPANLPCKGSVQVLHSRLKVLGQFTPAGQCTF